MSLRVASWNVNSLRVRLPHLTGWLGASNPDVIGLQETKLTDDVFPHADLEHSATRRWPAARRPTTAWRCWRGSRSPTWSPISPTSTIPQRRLVAATVNGVRYVNVYVPNGQAVGADKYEYKLRWLRSLRRFLQHELAHHERLVVMGDFNIAPEDRDVYDPVLWKDQILCSEPEREALRGLLGLGLADTFRLFEQAAGSFSWWDYRQGGFRRNLGLRIDLLLASNCLAAQCVASGIDTGPRRAERPSDHAPATADFDAGQ